MDLFSGICFCWYLIFLESRRFCSSSFFIFASSKKGTLERKVFEELETTETAEYKIEEGLSRNPVFERKKIRIENKRKTKKTIPMFSRDFITIILIGLRGGYKN